MFEFLDEAKGVANVRLHLPDRPAEAEVPADLPHRPRQSLRGWVPALALALATCATRSLGVMTTSSHWFEHAEPLGAKLCGLAEVLSNLTVLFFFLFYFLYFIFVLSSSLIITHLRIDSKIFLANEKKGTDRQASETCPEVSNSNSLRFRCRVELCRGADMPWKVRVACSQKRERRTLIPCVRKNVSCQEDPPAAIPKALN